MAALTRTAGAVAATLLLTALIWLVPQPDSRLPYRSTDALLQDLKQYQRGPVKQPSDWFMVQRVGPDGTLNMDAVRDARLQAKRLHSVPRELDEAWQFEGPTNIGGRLTGVAVHPDELSTVYVAGALGGVYKSTDAGLNFEPVFAEDFALSGGAIAIDMQNPDRIWFGTGEANASGDSYPGNGIYLSEDGGETWTWKGLPESYHIGRIVIDPTDSDRIFVAVMGKLFGFNEERGVYRTENGGDTWEQVFALNDTTGCVDIEINPLNPDTVYAVMWQRYRFPDRRMVAGINSGVWRSADGGDTWTHLTNGIPNYENVGRGSLAISPSNPNVLYLSHSNHPGEIIGVWKSTDSGDSWSELHFGWYHDYIYNSFGWYFGESIVDPEDPDIAYFGGVYILRTTNGGFDWVRVFEDAHVDNHGFLINPNNPSQVISVHDGGYNASQNRGDSSIQFSSLAATQFYAITHDPSQPWRLYGGTQDNGTMRTPDGSIDNWEKIFGADGFYCLVDPRDPDVIYVCYQNGSLLRSLDGGSNFEFINLEWADADDRTNWMTPYCFDPFNYDRLYAGTYRIWQTDNQGTSWTDISGDLTNGDDPGNLTYGTITTISASSVQQGLILVGTDDANVWYTDNAGAEWHQINQDPLPDMWVSRVATHPDSANIFYAAYSGHRVSDETPHLYRSDDFGANWTSVSGSNPDTQLPEGPINDVIIDPHDTARLYVANDYGVFVSLDYGQNWAALGEGLPMSAVFDLEFIPGERRLVAGTHGRSMYSILLGDLSVEDIPATIPTSSELTLISYPNPFNAQTTIRMNLPTPSNLTLVIYDLLGREVTTLASEQFTNAGVTEWTWNASSEDGLSLASGTYIVVATTDSEKLSRRLKLVK